MKRNANEPVESPNCENFRVRVVKSQAVCNGRFIAWQTFGACSQTDAMQTLI